VAARRPTLRDVARRAGVNPATASRALNPALPGRIAAPTERKVREAARALGYRPDPVARSLRTRRSGFVGVVVPDLTNPVIPPIVRGIEGVLWTAGIACLLADTDNDPEHEADLIEELLARRCEGLIVSTATRTSAAVTQLAGGDVPTVLVTRDIDVAHVTGPLNLSTTTTRLAAFEQASERLGIEIAGRVVHGEAFTTPAGRAAAERLLGAGREFTAIVAGNDLIALGCLQALTEAGLSCPDDISVVGHNDTPMVDSLQPPLTTVAIPQQEIGVQSAHLLLERLEGADVPSDPVLLPTELIVRGSTAPARPR
jgi:LacI family transcriptional regulator